MALQNHEDVVRVAFMEDEAAVAELYKLKLELDGYWVNLLPLADDAFERLRETAPDLIYIDLLGKSDAAIRLLSRIRQDEQLKNVPVIVLSDDSEASLIARGFFPGSANHLIRAFGGAMPRSEREWASV
jgi:two-component system alkaline phosphatase synthesis response regulator PhoP